MDDILGEESDNESEGGGKEERLEGEGEEEEAEGGPKVPDGEHKKALGTLIEERTATPSSEEGSLTGSRPRYGTAPPHAAVPFQNSHVVSPVASQILPGKTRWSENFESFQLLLSHQGLSHEYS